MKRPRKPTDLDETVATSSRTDETQQPTGAVDAEMVLEEMVLEEISTPMTSRLIDRALRPLFPEVPRSALRSMLHRFRDVRFYFEGRAMYTLQWTRPGAVWAMDHKDRTTMPIDGKYLFAFANRDLAANKQLDWLPVESKDAKTTDEALDARYREYGAPLVQKADRGFVAESTRKLVEDKWGHFCSCHRALYHGTMDPSKRASAR